MSSDSRILSIDELHKITRNPKTNGVQKAGMEAVREADELWSRLIETVRSPAVSDRHMTAACNAICFNVRANAQSEAEALKERAYSKNTWRQIFGAARAAFASGKNKPAIQILDTLHHLAETNPDRESVVQHVEETTLEMAKIVLSHHPRRVLKEACIVLYFSLRKLSDFMSFSDVLNQAFAHEDVAFFQLCHVSGIHLITLTDEAHPQWFAFVLALLLAVRTADSKSATLKLLAVLCSLPASTCHADLPGILSKSIDIYSSADETALEAVTRDVLPSVLTTKDLYMSFLLKQKQLDTSSTSAVLVVLTLLQYGKVKGYISESELPDIVREYCLESGTTQATSLPYDSFTYLLSCGSAAVRLRTCELLISSSSPTTPLPLGTLPCLAHSIAYVHNDTDTFHRSELLSLFRRFLARVHQSFRALENDNKDGTHNDILREYRAFHEQYLSFLKQDLSAGNSYPRHILALQMLRLMSDSPLLHDHTSRDMIFQDQGILMELFRLVLDPYDDVRALASEIISRAAASPTQQYVDTVVTLKPSETFSRLAATTNRADHADALGRVLSYGSNNGSTMNHGDFQTHAIDSLSQVSDQLTLHLLHRSAFDVTDVFPLHGVVLGARYMIERLTKDRMKLPLDLAEVLLQICQKIWTISQSHLCIDSPEMETESSENSDSGPKDRLAYAWRALRDSSLVMQAMLEHYGPNFASLQAIGDICFHQLALLRHRGAFSTVAQTFVTCCDKARGSSDPRIRGQIDRWFSEALDELENQADKLTRRSAGLPAILAALFDPANKPKFDTFFQSLIQKAEEKIFIDATIESEENLRLPQVHALNCIKEIMTSSRFRVMTEPLVVFTLNLAASCMSSKIWAIKNCGLMLLRASINRLDPETGLGKSEAGMKTRAVSNTERRPVDVATDFLSQPDIHEDSGDSTEAVFAGLDILSRLYIETKEQAEIKTLVTDRLGDPLWHIRAQAARLAAIMTPQGVELATISKWFSEDRSAPQSLNMIHGALMLVECLVQRLRATTVKSVYEDKLRLLLQSTLASESFPLHRTIVSIWLSTASQLFEQSIEDQTQFTTMHDTFGQVIRNPESLFEQPDALYYRNLATFRLHCYTLLGINYTQTLTFLLGLGDNVVAHIFENFRPSPNGHSKRRYLDILMHVAETRQNQRCLAVTMQAISETLKSADMEIDPSRIARLLTLLDFESLFSRELFNNQLTFFAALSRLAWTQGNAAAVERLTGLAGGFCVHLRLAADDQIELDSRYSAVKVLQQWKPVPDIRGMLTRLFGTVHQIDVLSVLYDLLNDDDEEIRDEASGFAALLLDGGKECSPLRTLSACAAATRHRLRDFMLLEFGDDKVLQGECLRRVLGMNMNVSRLRLSAEIGNHLSISTVSSQIEQIFDDMKELFIEEKQNLYVDEATEIKAWTVILARTSFGGENELRQKVARWSRDGAELLNTILKGRHPFSSSLFHVSELQDATEPQDGKPTSRLQPKIMFGTSMTEDLEVLATRLVASIRVSSESDDLHLVGLQETCDDLNMSQALLSSFSWPLNERKLGKVTTSQSSKAS